MCQSAADCVLIVIVLCMRARASPSSQIHCARERLLSLIGSTVIMLSTGRFRELSKRFTAIRLIFFLWLADACASAFNILGAFVDVDALLEPEREKGCPCSASSRPSASSTQPLLHPLDMLLRLRSTRRGALPHRRALRLYEPSFHMLCWLVPACSTLAASYFGGLGDSGSWCASLQYSAQYLICFYLPLLLAFAFNLVTYSRALALARAARVSHHDVLLLSFGLVWLPSLICRRRSSSAAPPPSPSCPPRSSAHMPLRGALNAVYGWSLPSIRDVYRTMLLAPTARAVLQLGAADERRGVERGSPHRLARTRRPRSRRRLPNVTQPPSRYYQVSAGSGAAGRVSVLELPARCRRLRAPARSRS